MYAQCNDFVSGIDKIVTARVRDWVSISYFGFLLLISGLCFSSTSISLEQALEPWKIRQLRQDGVHKIRSKMLWTPVDARKVKRLRETGNEYSECLWNTWSLHTELPESKPPPVFVRSKNDKVIINSKTLFFSSYYFNLISMKNYCETGKWKSLNFITLNLTV